MSTLSNNSQMHNDIMVAGSKEHPLIIALGNYAQWSSRFMRYVDTKPNKDQLRQCIENGPYILIELVTPTVLAEGDNPGQPQVVIEETYINTTHENRDLIDSEVEAVYKILNGITDNIYSTVDACFSAKEMIAKNDNPLALVAATQHYPDDYTQSPKPYKTHTHSSRQTTSTRTHATIQNKGKEIVKPSLPQSESTSEEDNDKEQAQRDKQMQKSLALLATHFKNIYRPTNNNLKTSSNTRNKNVDTSLRTGKGMIDRLAVWESEDSIPLSVEHDKWLQDTNEEPDEQELKAHYMYMAKIQEVLHAVDDNSRPTYDVEPLKKINTPYPSRKIRRIRACTHQRPQKDEAQYAVSRGLNTPYSRYGINIIFWKISNVVPNPRNPQYAISNTWIRRIQPTSRPYK
ncbi:hypothetical protein Tco_1074618 [Tanacetum coccineum]